MPKDPTANAAARNVTALERAAYVVYQDESGHKQRVWMDLATWGKMQSLVATLTASDGERHIRFPEIKR